MTGTPSARRLTEADITARTWAFGRVDAPPYAPRMHLRPGGWVTGHSVDTERSWRLDDGRLVLLDYLDRPTTVFDEVEEDAAGRLILRGDFQRSAGDPARHRLAEVQPLDRLLPSAAGAHPVRLRTPGHPRRNLVVICADERSLHHRWPRDIADEDRNWDLCVTFYGQGEPLSSYEEYSVTQRGAQKWEALHRLFHQDSPLWAYDFIQLMDDDLMLSWREMNELFVICRQYDLWLAQPSLHAGVNNNHPITGRRRENLLRFVSFVELMTPVFAREALRICAPTFGGNRTGFGLDNVWPRLLGDPAGKIAIIDKVSVLHTRPLSTTYDLAAAVREGNALQERYGAPSKVVEYGAVFAAERPMQ